MSWARLLGLGALASWLCLGIGEAQQQPGGLGIAAAWLCLLGVWGAFAWPPFVWKNRSEERWHGATLVASGIAVLGLGLREGFAVAPSGVWIFPLFFGVVALASSFLFRNQGRRGLFQLQSLLGLMALGITSPLRLGFRNGWLPVLRLLGLEALFAGGVFLRERFFRTVALVGFLLTFVEIFFLRLGIFGSGAPGDVRLATLLVVTFLCLANAFLLRRAWRAVLENEEASLAPPLFSSFGAGFLACLIWLHAPAGAVALLLFVSALAFQELADSTGHPELPRLALGLAGLSLVGLFAVSLPALALDQRLRVATEGALSLGFYVGWARVTLRSGRLSEGFRRDAGRLQLAIGLALAMFLVAKEASPAWVAPLLATLALVHLGVAVRTSRVEWTATSAAAWFATLVALGSVSWDLAGTSAGLDRRLLSVGATLALGYGGRLLLHRAAAPDALQRALGSVLGVLLPVLLAGLVWDEAPPLLVGPILAVALLLHAWRAARGSGIEGLVQVGELFLASLLAITFLAWPQGSRAFFSPRLGSVAFTIAAWYLVALLFLRATRRGQPLASNPGWQLLTDGPPVLGALGLGLAVKGEALAHDKNLLVALVWGVLGVLHLEGSRALVQRVWFRIFELALAAGAIHLLLVNIPQPGFLGAFSLRSLTLLPFLGLMAYAHFTVDDAARELALDRAAGQWKAFGILAGAVLSASYLLYELHRAVVLAAWAALALGYLLAWIRLRTPQLTAAALGLLVAILVRAVGVNLTLRDQLWGWRLNLVVIPVTCVLLLVSFLLLNREERATVRKEGFGSAGSRWWLLALLALATAHFWVEASGKMLTICWSFEGLAAVGLGFFTSERWARLAGLGLLSFCILKLFLYDLRGLEGLARILSFIILGLVLVGVSWVYTRFKERLL